MQIKFYVADHPKHNVHTQKLDELCNKSKKGLYKSWIAIRYDEGKSPEIFCFAKHFDQDTNTWHHHEGPWMKIWHVHPADLKTLLWWHKEVKEEECDEHELVYSTNKIFIPVKKEI